MPAASSTSATAASATINTLTIGGKQATRSVFRQLLNGVLIKEDGTFAGLPWGTVNDHQQECKHLQQHYHVVWQLGDDLRLDLVKPPSWKPFWSKTCDDVIFAAGRLGHTKWSDDFHWLQPKFTRRSGIGGKLFFDVDGLCCVARLPRNLPGVLRESEVAAHSDAQVIYQALVETLHSEVATEKQRRADVQARWQEIVDLRQLFITAYESRAPQSFDT